MAGANNRQGRPAAKPQVSDAPPQTTSQPEQHEPPTVEALVAAINDGTGDQHTVDILQEALYRAGAQDPSMELPQSWPRVQRRLGVVADGIATAEQVVQFADRVGLAVAR